MGLASVLNIVAVLPAFLEAITSLIQIAEALFSGKGQGAIKKDWVMNSIGNIVESMPVVTTGGAKESWEAISGNWDKLSVGVGAVIDFFVALIFPKVIDSSATDAPKPPVVDAISREVY